MEKLEGLDVIHLAKPASLTKQRKIVFLKAVLMERRRYRLPVSNPPKTFISASAIGFYGNQGTEDISEVSKKEKVWQMCMNNGNKVHKKPKILNRVIHPRIE